MEITKSSVCSDNVSNIHVYTTSYSYYLPTKRQTYFAHTEFVEYTKVRCSIKLFSLIFFINLYDYFIFISSSQFNEIHPLASRSSFMITQYWRQPLALRYKLSYVCRVLLTHMKCICSLMNKYRYGRGVSNEWKQTKQNQTKQKKIGTENMETLCCRRRSIFANLIYPKNVSHITYANIYRSHRNVGCDLKIAPKIKFWSAHTTHTHTQNHLWRTRRYAIREFVVAGLMKHCSLSAIRRAVHTHNIYVASNVCICII